MIHQSQLFFCPGQSYGISWNICLGRQRAKWDVCSGCPYRQWHQKGFPGFNPYAGSFCKTDDPRKKTKQPVSLSGRRVFEAPVHSFLPADIDLEEEKEEKNLKTLWQNFYSKI